MKTVNTARIIPSGIIREDCITVISKGGGTDQRGGFPITVSRYAINGMSVWEITPTNTRLGLDHSWAMSDMMTLLSGLMDTENTRPMTDGK